MNYQKKNGNEKGEKEEAEWMETLKEKGADRSVIQNHHLH